MPELLIPCGELEVVRLEIDFSKAHMSDYLRRRLEEESGIPDAARWLMGLEYASKSDYLENKVLDHFFSGKAETSKPQPWLALCSVVPEDGKTGSTITELAYTGYQRFKLEASMFGSAASGSSKNSSKLELAGCTGGSGTAVGWATVDASSAGNMLYWGTCSSTVISTTQTPPIVPIEGLVGNED
jgi:hypothetical protein